MNDLDQDAAYADAFGAALTLPTWVLRRWERTATHRASVGAPPRTEQAKLLAVRAVLARRDHR